MEYNDSETTETSNSESSSFNSEYEENETSKKIAELKQEIAKLENTNKIKQKKTKKLLTLNQPKISEAKSTDSKLAMKIKKGSNEPEQPISKGKYKHQNISSYLHIPKEFGMEFMRLLVAEKLYPLCPTTEYHDMPLSEINKCIDRDQLLVIKLKRHLNLVNQMEIAKDLREKWLNLTMKSMKKNNKQADQFYQQKIVHYYCRMPLLEFNSSNIKSLEELNNEPSQIDRVIQQKSDVEQETDQEVSQVKDHGNKHKATHNNEKQKETSQVICSSCKCNVIQQKGDEERETDEHEDDQEAPQVKHCGRKRKTTQKLHNIKSKKKSFK
ncbi:hypothetical protein GLOIN_2v1779028 [Rhizophagus irregularis DAOM 181602=DAOM 197198]|nr:hypothetical protein GLOIN_2v1779028 [Rhizophagus irregularis DAOM 181602=DAOM 197198]